MTRTIRALLIATMLASFTLIFAFAPVQAAITITVTETADDDPGGDNGFCSLREAIIAANTDTTVDTCTHDGSAGADTITLPAGTYTLTIAGTGEEAAATGDLDIVGDLIISATGDATIDGNGIDRVFHVISGSVAFDGTTAPITIRNGAADYGGGIYVNGAGTLSLDTVTVTRNTTTTEDGGGIYSENGSTIGLIDNTSIINNRAGDDGGGIYSRGAITTISNSTISNNLAAEAAGGIFSSGGITTISNSVISDNRALDGNGGGIYQFIVAIGTIEDTVFSGNSASELGGGIFQRASIGTIDNTLFSDNRAGDDGGAIYNNNIITTITHSTFSGNTSGKNGGAIYHREPITTITHSSFSGNSADENGGAIYIRDDIGSLTYSTIVGNTSTAASSSGGIAHNSGSIGTFENNLIADNSGSNCDGAIASDASNHDDDGTCGTNDVTPGTDYDTSLANNGCMTPLADWSCVPTHALLGTGVLEDNAGACGFTDERGVTRDATCDTGAFEYAGVLLVANYKCSGTDLVVTIDAGDTDFDISLDSPIVGMQATTMTALGSYTFVETDYGTWTNILITDGNGLNYYYPDVTCRPPSEEPPVAPIVEYSDPAITKSGSPENAIVGETVIWTVIVSNPGSIDTDNLVYVRDDIPPQFDIVGVTASPRGNVSINGQEVRVELGVLHPGEEITIIITTVANDLAQPGQVCNTVSADWNYTWTATACVNFFPDELPPTGGQPIARLWIAALGAMIALGLGGGMFVLRRKEVKS